MSNGVSYGGGADVDEIARRASVLNRGMAPFLRPVRDAPLALAALAQARDLIAFTSRPRSLHTTTVASLDQHFPDTFRDIKYLDGGWGDRGAIESVTKGEAAVRLGASTHIDDQVRHAVGMAGAGGVGLLFGDSHAAATATVGDGVVRVPTWRDVLRHADIDPDSVFPEN